LTEKNEKNLILFEIQEAPLMIEDQPLDHEEENPLDTDAKKISRVWRKLGLRKEEGLYSKDSFYRLGKAPEAGVSPRPILIKLIRENQKARIFSLAKKLKDESNEFYSKTYIKNDEIPAFQNGMKRLAFVCKMEKEKHENLAKMVIFFQSR
jgi:hypothetical protein